MSGSGRDGERGFALLIVLWTLVLITLLTSGLTASGRGEVKLAENLRNAALAEAAADGAAREAIFRLVAGQWAPGPVAHRVRIGGAVATVRIDDEAGLVNPNRASAALLSALLRAVGADAATAQTLAAQINQFHDAGGADPSAYIAAGLPYGPAMRNFRDVAELRLVAGMTPALYSALAPHLSVWTRPPMVARMADPVVLRALHDAGTDGDVPSADPSGSPRQNQDDRLFARITAATVAGGAQFTRIAEVQVFGQRNNSPRPPPYQIMSWSRPED